MVIEELWYAIAGFCAMKAFEPCPKAALSLALLGACLAGCTTPEPLPDIDRFVPRAYRDASPRHELPRPSSDWWREFSSAELNRLQENALLNNRDLQAAIARVAQAQAQARIAEGALYPNVEAYARREAEAPAAGVGMAETTRDWNQLNRQRLGLRTNYEADLWGKSGYAVDSALAQTVASVHQRETVALTLTADLAAAYIEYLSFNDRVVIAARGLSSRREQLQAVGKRLQQGEATALEVAQQRVALATAESVAATLEQRRERAFNRIAVLVGVSPPELALEARSLNGVAVPSIKAGLPSELLCRRPDVRRVEAQLAAAEFDVRSLRANLLPSFSLSGEIGSGARHLAALSNPASLFFLATGSLLQTVFDAGRKQNQVELARAKHLELLHQYSSVLLTALREVEDALAGTRLTEEQHRALAEAVQGAQSNYVLNRRSFEAGAVDAIALLDAEQRMIAAEDSSESARYDRLRAAVDLFRSLGGGSRVSDKGPCTG